MMHFIYKNIVAKNANPQGKVLNRFYQWQTLTTLLFILFGMQNSFAQNCSTGSPPTVLASWTFDAASPTACNGANGISANGKAKLEQDLYKYCPTTNAGCGQALLGSKGHDNTAYFANAMCLSDFYLDYSGLGTAASWDYKHPKNIRLSYQIPAGKAACLSSLSLNILAAKGMNGFGVTVLRNGVPVNTQTFAPTKGVRTINWTGSEFCSDGSNTVTTYTVYFGFWGTINSADRHAAVGVDDIYLRGTCGGPPTPVLTATPATCGSSGANANGSIKVKNFVAGSKYQYSLGSTFDTGTATPASPTAIPVDGVIVNTLANPSLSQPYTVRIFDAAGTCYQDKTITLNPVVCNDPCVQPTAVTLTAVEATCSGTTVNNDAQIQVTGVTSGNRVSISAGATYTGATYSAANVLVSGAYTFTGLSNPTGSRIYTVRVFNSTSYCYVDRTVELPEASCTPCSNSKISILSPGTNVTDNNSANNESTSEICKTCNRIDLSLTKTVNTNTGTICGAGGSAGTDFVWTLTLTNEGTMTAKNIQVSDLIPAGLTLVSSNPTAPNFTLAAGWQIDSLQAGQNTVLTLTTKALKAGTYTNCAQVNSAFPLNDPDSTPGNNSTTEDDDACATITVTGDSPPVVEKEFSPWEPKTNTPFRLMLKITNNQTAPITLTQDFVDALPSSPSQMVVASTPNISTQGMTIPVGAVLATANGTSVTIPKGTVLMPGLNQVFVDVNVTSDGIYCNDIAANALQTTGGSNCLTAEACVTAASTNNIPPLISKKFASGIANTNTNVLLTITIENSNASAMTLDQDFYDILPTGLVMGAGSNTGTCTGVAAFVAGDTLIKVNAGTVIPVGTCTIIVPVKSATVGQYCNRIYHNSMMVTVNGESGLGSRGLADDCVTIVSNPCTTIDVTAITANPVSPFAVGSTVTLTPTITGAGASTVYQWSATPTTGNGFYNNTGVSPATWTPTSTGTYTLKLVADNSLTGFGECKDSITLDVVVQSACVQPLASATPSTQTICNGSTPLTYTATPTTGVEYKWYGPLADTTSGLGTAINGATTTTYTPTGTDITTIGTKYYAIVVNNIGNTTCSDTAFVALTVNPLPSTPSVTTPVMNSCPATTVNLNNISAALTPSVSGGVFEWHMTNSSASPLVSNPTQATSSDYYLFERTPTSCYSMGAKLTVAIQPCTVDLSLTKTVNNSMPAKGANVVFSIKVKNESSNNASGVSVHDSLPVGMAFISATPNGVYDPNTHLWSIGNLAAGDSTTLTMTVRIDSVGVNYNTAEIHAMNETDTDSSPNNNNTSEDDISRVCVSVPVPLCTSQGKILQLVIASSFTNIRWFRNGVEISGQTANTLNVSQTGDYTFTANEASCPIEGCCPVQVVEGNCSPVCKPIICLPVVVARQ